MGYPVLSQFYIPVYGLYLWQWLVGFNVASYGIEGNAGSHRDEDKVLDTDQSTTRIVQELGEMIRNKIDSSIKPMIARPGQLAGQKLVRGSFDLRHRS